MSERTAIVGGVRLTHAQVEEARRQLATPERVRFALQDKDYLSLAGGGRIYAQSRTGGSLAGRGLWLDTNYTWQIETDDLGYAVLTAIPKETP